MGCSKRPDFSPAQPWRAETRLFQSKAAASEAAKRTLRYVEPLSDARTMLAGFFSILHCGSTTLTPGVESKRMGKSYKQNTASRGRDKNLTAYLVTRARLARIPAPRVGCGA